jgi:hypothetical protein
MRPSQFKFIKNILKILGICLAIYIIFYQPSYLLAILVILIILFVMLFKLPEIFEFFDDLFDK